MTDTFKKRARVLSALKDSGALNIEVYRQSLKHKTKKVIVTYDGKHVTQDVLTKLFFPDFYEIVIAAFDKDDKVTVGNDKFKTATAHQRYDKVIRDLSDDNAKELKERYLKEMKNVQ